jgi:hypothetical protein
MDIHPLFVFKGSLIKQREAWMSFFFISEYALFLSTIEVAPTHATNETAF